MKRQMRPLALFACITAATAFSGQLAMANSASPDKDKSANCGEQQRHGRHKGDFLKKMTKELGLSSQQQTKVKAILEASRAENKPLFQAMMTERRQLRSLIMSGSADEAAIRAQSAKVASVQADLAVMRAQEAKQLQALLTPDQLTKLKAFMEKREKNFGKFGRHGEGRHEEGPMM